jgi:hypothetical protein
VVLFAILLWPLVTTLLLLLLFVGNFHPVAKISVFTISLLNVLVIVFLEYAVAEFKLVRVG